jgi:hypothetical protein
MYRAAAYFGRCKAIPQGAKIGVNLQISKEAFVACTLLHRQPRVPWEPSIGS